MIYVSTQIFQDLFIGSSAGAHKTKKGRESIPALWSPQSREAVRPRFLILYMKMICAPSVMSMKSAAVTPETTPSMKSPWPRPIMSQVILQA